MVVTLATDNHLWLLGGRGRVGEQQAAATDVECGNIRERRPTATVPQGPQPDVNQQRHQQSASAAADSSADSAVADAAEIPAGPARQHTLADDRRYSIR